MGRHLFILWFLWNRLTELIGWLLAARWHGAGGWALACGLPMPVRYARQCTATALIWPVIMPIYTSWPYGRGVIPL